eukprot:g42122.t1
MVMSRHLESFGTVDSIRNGIDILVGTPGRIRDHLQNMKIDLSKLKHVVLDEVDQMLDMGFAEQVEDILKVAYKKARKFQDFDAPTEKELQYWYSEWLTGEVAVQVVFPYSCYLCPSRSPRLEGSAFMLPTECWKLVTLVLK